MELIPFLLIAEIPIVPITLRKLPHKQLLMPIPNVEMIWMQTMMELPAKNRAIVLDPVLRPQTVGVPEKEKQNVKMIHAVNGSWELVVSAVNHKS